MSSNSKQQTHGATVVAATLNLVNTVIGAGTLGLPYAFYRAGLVPALLIFFLMVAVSMLTFNFMVYVCDCILIYSFGDVAGALFGPIGILLCAFAAFIHCFGILWAYVAMSGDFVISFFSAAGVSEDSVLTSRWFVTLLLTIVIFIPFSWFRRVDSLKLVSSFAIFAILFAILSVFIRMCTRFADKDIDTGTPEVVHPSLSLVQCFSTICFAFACQQSGAIIHGELIRKKAASMRKVVIAAFTICSTAYLFSAIPGYLQFTDQFKSTEKSPGNILNMYDDNDYLILVARVFTIFVVLFSYPLLHIPCRVAFFNIIRLLYDIFTRPSGTAVRDIYQGKNTLPPLIPPEWKQVKYSIPLIHLTRHHLATGITGTFSALLTMTLGMLLPDVSFVFDLIGSTAGACVAFIIPSIFYIRIKTNPVAYVNPHRTYYLDNHDKIGTDTVPEGMIDGTGHTVLRQARDTVSGSLEHEHNKTEAGQAEFVQKTQRHINTQDGTGIQMEQIPEQTEVHQTITPTSSPSQQPLLNAQSPHLVASAPPPELSSSQNISVVDQSEDGQLTLTAVSHTDRQPTVTTATDTTVPPSDTPSHEHHPASVLSPDAVPNLPEDEEDLRKLMAPSTCCSPSIILAWAIAVAGVLFGIIALAMAIIFDTNVHEKYNIQP